MNNKETFFDLVKEYLENDFETYRVYKFKHDDLENIKWFIEMVWSVSEDFNINIVRETPFNDSIYIYLRTQKPHWVVL